ncbi:MAG: RNA polymerase sigma factor [Armatimonadota bacterium]
MARTDTDLVARCLEGDLRAFDELVQRHQRPVYNVCLRMLGDRDEAADLSQDAFVRAYSRLTRFERGRAFRPWLLRIAINLCLNALRGRRPALPVDHGDSSEAGVVVLRAESQGPDQALEARELTTEVQRAVLSLPETYRAVAVLRHVEGMKYEEIAEVTGLPMGTVKTHLFRAKNLLRQSLAHLFEDAGEG